MVSVFDVSADPLMLDAFCNTSVIEVRGLWSLAAKLRRSHAVSASHVFLSSALAIEQLAIVTFHTQELAQTTSSNLKSSDNHFSLFEITHDLSTECGYPSSERYRRFVAHHKKVDELIGEGKPLAEIEKLEKDFAREELERLPQGNVAYYEELLAIGTQPFVAMQRASSPQKRVSGFTHQDNNEVSNAMLKGKKPAESNIEPEFFPLQYRELHERLTIKNKLRKKKDAFDGVLGIGGNESALKQINEQLKHNDAAIALLVGNGQYTKSGKAASVSAVVDLQKNNVASKSIWAANYSADIWLRDQDYGSKYGDHGLNNVDVRALGMQLEGDSLMAAHFFRRLGVRETGKIPTLLNATKQANYARKEGFDVLDSYGRALASATSRNDWYNNPGSFTGEELMKAPFGWHGTRVRHSAAMLFKDGIYDQQFLSSGLLSIIEINSIYDPEVFSTMDSLGRHGNGPRSILLEAIARSGHQTSSSIVQKLAREEKLEYLTHPIVFNEGYNGHEGYVSVLEQASRNEKSAQLLLEVFTQTDDLDGAIKDPRGLEKYQAKALEQILANNIAAVIPSEGLGNVSRRRAVADITGNGAITEHDAKRWNYAVARVVKEGGGEHYYASVLGLLGQSFDRTLAHRTRSSSLSLRQDLVEDGTQVASFTGKARHMLYQMRLSHNKNLDKENAKKKKHTKSLVGLGTKKVPPIFKPAAKKAVDYSVEKWLNLPTDNMVGFMGSEYDIESVDTIRARQGLLELLARNEYIDGFTLVSAQTDEGWPTWIVAKTDLQGQPILRNGGYVAATEEDFSSEGKYRTTKIVAGKEEEELLVSEVLDYESEVTSADEKAWLEQSQFDAQSDRLSSDLVPLFSIDVR